MLFLAAIRRKQSTLKYRYVNAILSADPTTAVKSNPQVKRPGADIRSQASSPQKKVKPETASDNFS